MLNRRKLIISLSALLAGVAQRGICQVTRSQPKQRGDFLSELLGAGYDIDLVGRCYIRRYTDESTIQALGPLMQPYFTGDDMKTTFKRASREDFAQENTVILEGWVLSRSEARCCAYLYLKGAGYAA